MKTKITLFFILFLSVFQTLEAQDRIFFLDKTLTDVRIETVNTDQIIYYEMKDGVEIRKEISPKKVRSILWADGTTTSFDEYYADAALYEGQSKRALKLHLLAPLIGHTSISYEHILRPGKSLEYTLGIIGLGNRFNQGSILNTDGLREELSENQRGVYVAFGYRKYSAPAARLNGKRYKHVLQGWYMMPRVIMGYYKSNQSDSAFFTNEVNEETNIFGNIMFYGGKQIVFAECILIDWQVGAGFGLDGDDNESSNHYAVSMVDGFAIGGGVRLGFVF